MNWYRYPFSNDGRIERAHEKNTVELLTAVHGNFGNLAFQYPLEVMLSFPPQPWPGFDFFQSNANDSGLMISAANWLTTKGEGQITEELIAAMESARTAVIFGLGAQAPFDTKPHDFTAALSAAQGDRIHRISELVPTIAVRDNFTARVLAEMDIQNVQILGCPSFLIAKDGWLGSAIGKKCEKVLLKDQSNVRVTVNEFTPNPYSRHLTRKGLVDTLDFVLRFHAHYVLQGRHCLAAYHGESEDMDQSFDAILTNNELVNLRRVLQRHSFVFNNVPDWIAYYQSRDLVVGTRIHGAILALQAGTPAVLLAHDSRTCGLAEVLGIPSFRVDRRPLSSMDLHELVTFVRKCCMRLNGERMRLAGQWMNFFQQHHVR